MCESVCVNSHRWGLIVCELLVVSEALASILDSRPLHNKARNNERGIEDEELQMARRFVRMIAGRRTHAFLFCRQVTATTCQALEHDDHPAVTGYGLSLARIIQSVVHVLTDVHA